MLPALHDDQRRSFARLALMLCTFAIASLTVTAPSGVVASARDAIAPRKLPSEHMGTLVYPNTDLRRDPFVPDAAYRPAPAGAAANIAGAGSAVVRAIVTGAEPRALVELNGTVRVVSIGERIGQLAVIGINRRGVVVDGGLTLPLVQGQP